MNQIVGGQGIASGFRDAIALSWRLAILCTSRDANSEGTLAGWYIERKQQLVASLASTIKNGNMVNSKNPWKIFARDWGLWLLQLISPVKRWIQLGPRIAGRTQYTFEPGMAFMPELGGGALFSQSFCVAITQTPDQECDVLFTDDVVFSEHKKAVFQLVVFMDGGLDELLFYEQVLGGFGKISPRLHPDEATFFVGNGHHAMDKEANSDVKKTIFRIATADEFFSSPLSQGRPYPHGYRETDMRLGLGGKKFAIVRSDRFVFAACDTREELEVAATKLGELFPA